MVLLDTSASMNQRNAMNLSLLDIAKAGIEQMVRRFPSNLKFLLVTTRNGGTLQSGWLDSQDDFLTKVKNTVARDLSNLPVQSTPCMMYQKPAEPLLSYQLHLTMAARQGALRCAMDTLEQRRSYADLETYGMGRQPWVTADAGSIWVITDGCSLNHEGMPMCSLHVRIAPCASL